MKTKTETQIAEEKINEYRIRKEGKTYVLKEMLQHKEDSQRFLGFLEALTKWGSWERMSIFAKQNVNEKITDLKQAIKLYEDAGI